MPKNKQSNGSREDESQKTKVNDDKKLPIPKRLSELREKTKGLSYESSLNNLDKVLDSLQKEDIPVEELQQQYLVGRLYLEHCEYLLEKVEQSIKEIDTD